MADQSKFSCRLFPVYAADHRLFAESIEPVSRNSARDRTTLVFLHEGLGSIAQWRDFPAAVCAATGLPAFVYERLGHGRSDPLTGPRQLRYMHDEALIVLKEVLERNIEGDVVLIGHSDGGSIALIFASAYPARIRGVITEAAHVFVEKITVEGIRRAVDAFEKSGLREALARYHGDNTDLMFRGWADIWLSPEFFQWNIESYLPGITCPLLAIQGMNDEYGSPAQVEAIIRGVKGRAESLLIPQCGHVPHFQARSRVLSETTRFISSLNP
ncbi:MAG: alpha/beta fold hydrolase [Syntrophales bacterium]